MSSCRNVIPDKRSVEEGFSRAAEVYDRYAHHHRAISKRFMELLPTTPKITSILETGCGTGILTGHLLRRFPSASITAIDISSGMIHMCKERFAGCDRVEFIVADADDYVPENEQNLVISSCAAQWLHDSARYPVVISPCLSPRGLLALAVPVEGSLPELVESFRYGALKEMGQLELRTRTQWNSSFLKADLEILFSRLENVCHEYSHPIEVLKAVKGIGASLRRNDPAVDPGRIRKMLSYYRKNFSSENGCVKSTYRIHYICGRRKVL
jgi:malonyl-CoA O-methyltransferase